MTRRAAFGQLVDEVAAPFANRCGRCAMSSMHLLPRLFRRKTWKKAGSTPLRGRNQSAAAMSAVYLKLVATQNADTFAMFPTAINVEKCRLPAECFWSLLLET